MSESRTNGRRSRSRAFRPSLDGRLEDRMLMTVGSAAKIAKQLDFSQVLAQASRAAATPIVSTNRRFCPSCTASFPSHGFAKRVRRDRRPRRPGAVRMSRSPRPTAPTT